MFLRQNNWGHYMSKVFLSSLQDLLGDGNPMAESLACFVQLAPVVQLQVVANAVAGLAEISQTCGKDLLDLDKAAS